MNYRDMFASRGSSYDRAMQRWPDARCDDFLVPLDWLRPGATETLVDVPAGGGYLRRYLPSGCKWFGHEPCASFNAQGTRGDVELLPLPWADGFADAAISIAGVHHQDAKIPLFQEFRRVVRPGGRFLLADVHEASDVARFLDDFVGAHNSTGHSGTYLGLRTLDELATAGWTVTRSARVRFAWWFADRASLAEFCRMLFDMPAVEDVAVLDAVERHLGFAQRGDQIGMNWELYLLLAHAG